MQPSTLQETNTEAGIVAALALDSAPVEAITAGRQPLRGYLKIMAFLETDLQLICLLAAAQPQIKTKICPINSLGFNLFTPKGEIKAEIKR